MILSLISLTVLTSVLPLRHPVAVASVDYISRTPFLALILRDILPLTKPSRVVLYPPPVGKTSTYLPFFAFPFAAPLLLPPPPPNNSSKSESALLIPVAGLLGGVPGPTLPLLTLLMKLAAGGARSPIMLSAFLNGGGCADGGPLPIGVVEICGSVDGDMEDMDRSICGGGCGGPLILAELPGRLP